MAIQLDENGDIERMTREEYEAQLKEAKTKADEAAATVAKLASAQAEGKVEPPKQRDTKGHFKPAEKTGGNMEELRSRLEDLRLDIAKMSTSTPGYVLPLSDDLKKVKEQVQYIHDYVNGRTDPPKKEKRGPFGLW